MRAGRNLDVNGSNVTIAGVTDSTLLDSYTRQGQGNFTHVRNQDELARASQLSAGHKLSVNARSDAGQNDQGHVRVTGSQLRAEDALTLNADQDIVIQEARERHESFQACVRGSIWT